MEAGTANIKDVVGSARSVYNRYNSGACISKGGGGTRTDELEGQGE